MSDTTGDTTESKSWYQKYRHKKLKSEKQHTTKQKGLLQRWIGYEWITKNLVFFLFLSLLAVIYIANGHMADNTIRDINSTAKEVKELQYEYKSLKSEAIFKSRETEVVQAATPLGLKISTEQPMRLTVDEKSAK
ncbi:FtsL-like putative cell division protein [Panacibacter ginsenosidivorans]|uniref:FtsL-like putative cell division protein n=1 Tax=Panacibacter ginsenosidivorans TaxID=1813871 RepID=UPI001CEF64EE|nr:FtsL-like putative cell division protein [Panacibacter ginsenosidivorans]